MDWRSKLFPGQERMMRRGRFLIIAGLFAAFSLLVQSGAESKTRFDGYWGIFISGTPGSCEFGYRIFVRVRDGLVSWQGRNISRSMIGISSGGFVVIRLSDGQHVVTGSGAVDSNFGNGKWSAPAFRCGGHWDAFKR
jgi:hypothetical protein